MSVSIESATVLATPRLTRLAARIASRLQTSLSRRATLASWRQRVGDVSVWDGQARFRLPGAGDRHFFRVSLYVTVRRAPHEDEEGPDFDPPAGAAGAAVGAATENACPH